MANEKITFGTAKESVEKGDKFRYPENFKRTVVAELLNSSVAQLAKKHSLPRITIERWAKSYSMPMGGKQANADYKDQEKIVVSELKRKLDIKEAEIRKLGKYIRTLERRILNQMLKDNPITQFAERDDSDINEILSVLDNHPNS